MKKKKIYPIINALCPRCGQIGKHIPYIPEYAVYKCTICNNIHV